jgi:hypothetical protein
MAGTRIIVQPEQTHWVWLLDVAGVGGAYARDHSVLLSQTRLIARSPLIAFRQEGAAL